MASIPGRLHTGVHTVLVGVIEISFKNLTDLVVAVCVAVTDKAAGSTEGESSPINAKPVVSSNLQFYAATCYFWSFVVDIRLGTIGIVWGERGSPRNVARTFR